MKIMNHSFGLLELEAFGETAIVYFFRVCLAIAAAVGFFLFVCTNLVEAHKAEARKK